MNLKLISLFFSRFFLCLIIFVGFQSNLNNKRWNSVVEKIEEHSHALNTEYAFNYLLDSAVVHDHHHSEKNDTEGHSHEHSHNVSKIFVSFDILPINLPTMVFLSSSSIYSAKPLLLLYGAYVFRIFRPPMV